MAIAFFALALGAWAALAQRDVLGGLYVYSRDHAAWNVGGIAMLFLALTLALLLSSIAKSRRLQRHIDTLRRERVRADLNARHDPLTGLFNRRALDGLVNRMEADGANRVVGILDIDRFKPVNDLHGHAVGDRVLREASERLKEIVGTDGELARLGGDEFAILFERHVSAHMAERLACRIVNRVAHPIDAGGVSVTIGCSIGLATWVCGDTASEALARADQALHAAKSQGFGRHVWYDAEMERKAKERAGLEADLRIAIREGRIDAWFQPLVRFSDNRLSGFELLARWTHPDKGNVSPEVFVEIAEDSGLIGDLGWLLLRKGCKAAAEWNAQLQISFNLSPKQFQDSGLVATVEAILTETGLEPARLNIEITETAVVQDIALARAKIGEFKRIGITVSLDDFGTGYSALSSLRDLPFDRIKIDKSFVTGLCEDPSNVNIVKAIVAMGRGLNMRLTAEGIETEAEARFLADLGCDYGQGHHFARALPADQVAWLLETEWSDGLLRAAPAASRDAGRAGEL
ncbi:MAG: EAL domain-containing protein [Pseudomonadota bacterium]